LFCYQIPKELYDVEFPWFRQIFLLFAATIYTGDIGLDIFVAYEHHKHYLEGDKDSKWYFMLTIVFIVLPSTVMNFVSWGLYTWCYIVNSWPQCHNFLRKKSLRLKKFGSDLMYVNYSGVYSPTTAEALQRRRQRATMPPIDLKPRDSLKDELRDIASKGIEDNSEALERQPHRQSLFDDQSIFEQDDEVDGNIEFRAIDNFDLTSLWIITILHVLQLGLLVRILRLIYLSSKDKYSYYRYYDLTFLRLIESFMESAPQLILQLYIYVVNPTSDPVYRIVTPISMLFSLVSLALAITDYHSAGKDLFHYMFKNNSSPRPRLSWTAYFVIIFWQLCLIISRTLAFTFFATEFGLYLFAFLLAHFLLMVFWIYLKGYKMCICDPVSIDQTDSNKRIFCNYRYWLYPFTFLTRNCCLELVIAAFNSFFFFKFTWEKSKLTWILYYLLQAIENFTLICLFLAFTNSPAKWNSITGFSSTFVSFFLGMGFMGLYYYYFHPVQAKSTHSEDEPDLGVVKFKSKIAREFLTFTSHWLIPHWLILLQEN